MEEYLANKVIKKVYKGKSGEGKYGPWTAWNFYIDGDDRKFSYFSTNKNPEPVEGGFIAMMKFEQNDKYFNVKDIAYGSPEENEPRQDPQAGPPNDYEPPGKHEQPPKIIKQPDEKLSFYVSYAKDLMVALINQKEYPEGITLKDAADQVMSVGKEMQRQANEVPF